MNTEVQDIKVVVDLETTGLDYKREKIIEFAAVKLVDNQITEEIEMLIDPQQEIRHSSIEIHGITQDMLEGAPTIEEAMPKILDFIKDYTIIAHNAIFDHSFLNQASIELYEEPIPNDKIDTFQMYKEVFPEEQSHGLESLLKRFNIDFPVKHRAMADAKGLALVYPHLKHFYGKKCEWHFSQLKNIDYLFERYLRIQNMIQILQSEMSDLKSIFKVYFQENGKEITATTGETLTCFSKTIFNYDIKTVKSLINEADLQDKAFKINTAFIEKLIYDSNTSEELRQKLIECRTDIKEVQNVQIIRPEKAQV